MCTMKNCSRSAFSLLLLLLTLTSLAQQQWNVDKAAFNPKTTEIIKGPGNIRSATLKKNTSYDRTTPDLTFIVDIPREGTYEMTTRGTTEQNMDTLIIQGKVPTILLKIQINQQRPTQRIVFDSWNHGAQTAGKFDLKGKQQKISIWLPKGVRLQSIGLKTYTPPAVPVAAQQYKPAIIPPSARPRLWLNEKSLPIVRARLNTGDNQPAWNKVKEAALRPFPFVYNPQQEIFYNEAAEKAAEMKAFYYLMTGDKNIGSEAVQLMAHYLTMLEFGNVKYGDITREVGRAIYTGALVYDWCYDLLSREEKQILYQNMMRLAREMEIGWPPFDNSAINGHGNEAQVNRDLLAMSIAIYDEDPLPYQYTSYIILEQLVPMRRFEYASPRHNQGVDYGAYRFGWEMHAAWLFYRMTGQTVFDDNIKNLPSWWLYMRLPDGTMLHDGDMFSVRAHRRPGYWKQPQTMLLSYAYANDPLIKGEFEREGGLPDNPVLFLLVNDPKLKADPSLQSLPLTRDFGPVIGGMIARTGWNNTPGSNDVIAQIKGGGYHFGNHQHADAGNLQIYYHGMQVGDIGLYLSYGTPYDFNFNKRSVSHSMMLARDPAEPLLFRTTANDGGSRFNQRFPVTPQETTTDPWFNYGTVLSAAYGPSTQTPSYSYFMADLTAAYTDKMSSYARGFCFLSLGREDVPAAIILTDDMTTAQSSFKKYWQINTLKKPALTPTGFQLHNEEDNVTGYTYVDMLLPSADKRNAVVLGGDSAASTFGAPYVVNAANPEANGYRIMVSPSEGNKRDRFLTVFQMEQQGAAPLPLHFYETAQCYVISLANRLVVMPIGAHMIDSTLQLSIPGNGACVVVLNGMAPGFWNIKGKNNAVDINVNIIPGKNTCAFQAAAGEEYSISPGRSYEGKRRKLP